MVTSVSGVLLFAVFSYLVGSIPVAYIVGRIRGVDITRTGTGNAGGSNAFIVLGPAYGILVGVLDLLKGFMVGWLALHYFSDLVLFYVGGMLVVFGQCYPLFVRFRGGKGMGTAAGTFLAAMPVLALCMVVVWLFLLLVTKRSSTANLLVLWIALVATWYLAQPFTAYVALVTAWIYYTHRDNIERIARGVEVGISDLMKKR